MRVEIDPGDHVKKKLMSKPFALFLSMYLLITCSSCERTFEPITPPPSPPPVTRVSITSPANNSTVIDSVLIVASASDDVGVVKVEFYIDGVLVNVCTKPPWQYNWNVQKLTTNTTHTVQAKVYDIANNIGSSAMVSVTTKRTAEFLFPLAVGAQWTYSHTYHWTYTLANQYGTMWGTVGVKAISSVQWADSTVWLMSWKQRDSVHYQDFFPGRYQLDTFYVNLVDTNFSVVVYRDRIEARWASLVFTSGPKSTVLSSVPKWVADDTVKVVGDEYRTASYVTGIGLFGYVGLIPANHFYEEHLNLLSFSGH